MSKSNSFRTFMSSGMGCFMICAITLSAFLGIICGLGTISPEATAIPCIICIFFGWRALNAIQPEMFLWMSLFGWLIYFLIKAMLSLFIGVFVAPIKIGKWVHTSFFCDTYQE